MNTCIYDGKKDAFGAALYDFYKKKEGFVVIERSDGFIDYDDAAHYFDDIPQWSAIEKEALKYARGTILDVGAGAGRVSLYLQKRGKTKVFALDNSPLALKVCALRGIRNTVLSPIVSYGPSFKYDTIIMYGNNFGLMQNHEIAVKTLNSMYDYTTQDAKIILETMDVYKTKLKEHLDYQRQNRKLNRISGQIKFRIRYKLYTSPWHDYLFVNKNELQGIVNKTNWRINKYFVHKGPAYIALLAKPAL